VLGLKLWPTAIPQYELGHLGIIDELEKAEASTPGLWVCGNYRSGVAFPDCVTFGYEKAKEVQEFLAGLKAATASPPAAAVQEVAQAAAVQEAAPAAAVQEAAPAAAVQEAAPAAEANHEAPAAESWPALGGTTGPHRMAGTMPPPPVRERWIPPPG